MYMTPSATSGVQEKPPSTTPVWNTQAADRSPTLSRLTWSSGL